MTRWSVPTIGQCVASKKRQFASRRLARDAARKTGPHCNVYRCQHCGEYHVTSQSPRLKRAIAYLLDSLRKTA